MELDRPQAGGGTRALIARTNDPVFVRDLLGHAKLSTTDRYLKEPLEHGAYAIRYAFAHGEDGSGPGIQNEAQRATQRRR